MKTNFKLLSITVFVTVSLIFTGCKSTENGASSTDGIEPVTVEFESGVIEGNIVLNVGPDQQADGELDQASGDMLYMKDSGSIEVTFNAPVSGDYIVKIFYALPDTYGSKENNVIINGEDLGAMSFPITQGKWAAKWIQTSLKEGKNSISVAYNWGYTWFDYLTFEPIN